MQPPSPALVSQDAVRRLPRIALLLLCLTYVLAGFLARSPWKSDDMASYGYMQALAQGHAGWWQPELVGVAAEPGNWLALWLGAWVLQWTSHWGPGWLEPELAVRIPFMLLVALSLACVWWACFFLARTRGAQPVPFAFGGEASPKDYARALADGAVLAMIASLGFVQFSHETTWSVVQLAGASLLFLGFALGFHHAVQALLIASAGSALLLLSGAAHWLLLAGCGAVALCWLTAAAAGQRHAASLAPAQEGRAESSRVQLLLWPMLASVLFAAVAFVVWRHGLWLWQPAALWSQSLTVWQSLARMLIWFSWPVWPLCLWALWRWRKHWLTRTPSFHISLPLWFSGVAIAIALNSTPADRALFLALPVFAVLAAFAMPTMQRAVSALIDWFTLLFFTICGITIWIIWLATQTGVPTKPAANVAKLAPEYVPRFEWLALLLALLATVIWLALVAWRTGRHRSALWKSLVLPAGGATWCLVLVMTLWLPMLDYGKSYTAQISKLEPVLPRNTSCVAAYGLRKAQLAAFRYQGQWPLVPGTESQAQSACAWSLVNHEVVEHHRPLLLAQGWQEVARVDRPTDDEPVYVFQRR